MTEILEGIFVLKDNKGNYIGSNSISYDRESKQYIYSYSKYLTNGFYTYQCESDALNELDILQEKAIKIKIGTKFHVERINRFDVLSNESKMDISQYPFIHECIKAEGLATSA